jgi:cytochrome P450
LRKLLNKGFSAAAVEGLRPQVEAIVDQMLKPLQHGAEVDLMREFANPMPVRIILEMLGIPQELRDTFVDWSRAIAVFRGNPNRTVEEATAAQDALVALTEFFRKTVAERRRNKGSDLISLLIDIEEEGEVLTEEELYAQCIALLFAGHETTRNLIGNGMYTLLQHPQETAELRERPDMIRSAVEELLRFESPVQFTARVLKEDIEVCGQPIRKGWTVLCMLGAANRDPKQFKEPDQLDLKRLNNQHLAFSAGLHDRPALVEASGAWTYRQLALLFPRHSLASRFRCAPRRPGDGRVRELPGVRCDSAGACRYRCVAGAGQCASVGERSR